MAYSGYLTFHECHYCKVPLAFRNGGVSCDNCGRIYGMVEMTDTPDGKFVVVINWYPQTVDSQPERIELVQRG